MRTVFERFLVSILFLISCPFGSNAQTTPNTPHQGPVFIDTTKQEPHQPPAIDTHQKPHQGPVFIDTTKQKPHQPPPTDTHQKPHQGPVFIDTTKQKHQGPTFIDKTKPQYQPPQFVDSSKLQHLKKMGSSKNFAKDGLLPGKENKPSQVTPPTKQADSPSKMIEKKPFEQKKTSQNAGQHQKTKIK